MKRDPLEPPRIQLFFPRGDVRLADLDAFTLQINIETYAGPGRVEFRRGSEVLARIADFDPPFGETWLPIPEEVRRAVHVGDEVSWGWFPAEGHKAPRDNPAVTATFRVVDTDVAKPLARIDTLRTGEADTGHVRELLRASLLRDKGLLTASFREAYAVLQTDPDDRRACGLVLEILTGWGDKAGAHPSAFRQGVSAHLRTPGGKAPTLVHEGGAAMGAK